MLRPIPRLYPILDAGLLFEAGITIESFARELYAAGIRFLQYRDKAAPEEVLLQRAAQLRRIFSPAESCLVLNDRVSLLLAAGYDGVHVGQDDLPAAAVRALVGEDVLLGVSTHGELQWMAAAAGPANYVAIGPVFATRSKRNPDPVIGLAGVRAARALTTKPLVAIGGITRSNCAAVLAAGADSVAVISGLIPGRGESPGMMVEQYKSSLEPRV